MPLMKDNNGSKSLIVRNRLNQRNFRARRQQYVQELEQKVRTLEGGQLDVARRIQHAARLVAVENQALRAILRENLMLSEADIDLYVNQATQAVKLEPIQMTSQTSSMLNLSRTKQKESDQLHAEDVYHQPESENQLIPDALLTAKDVVHHSKGVSTSIRLSAPQPDSQNNHSLENDSRTQPNPSSQFSRQRGPACQNLSVSYEPGRPAKALNTACVAESGSDAMCCEHAAAILASLRTNSNLEEARQELGCGPQDECAIHNSIVFQALNAYI